MELSPKFDVIYMEAAIDFLESLPEKAKDKIAYNISKKPLLYGPGTFQKVE